MSYGNTDNSNDFNTTSGQQGFDRQRQGDQGMTDTSQTYGSGQGQQQGQQQGQGNWSQDQYGDSGKRGRTDDQYGSGTGVGGGGAGGQQGQYDTSSSGYGQSGGMGQQKPSTGDRMRGGAEKIAGKLTGKPDLVERGQERSTGQFDQGQNY